MSDQDLQGLVRRGRDAITAFRDATREGRTISFRERDELVAVLHEGLDALERLSAGHQRPAGRSSGQPITPQLFRAREKFYREVANGEWRQEMPDYADGELATDAAMDCMDAAAALEAVTAKRGTCSSCRFYQCGYPMGHCDNDRSAASTIVDAMAPDWGCSLHQPQPTATEEASK